MVVGLLVLGLTYTYDTAPDLGLRLGALVQDTPRLHEPVAGEPPIALPPTSSRFSEPSLAGTAASYYTAQSPAQIRDFYQDWFADYGVEIGRGAASCGAMVRAGYRGWNYQIVLEAYGTGTLIIISAEQQ